ncbi:hypothetical protein BD324DRAFT_610862 [Kockovaella imperatae]|uniref:Uncharacterized protein n=1 Tax=Kockovaella imperatae TaxID=4999 RepID=A0A1Y1UQZ9_9TREE|nr:hypothetical protein BD324DRAFT_610862 [Kockovaella imperatae]ORX40471.1 hypothetical protein BD324DRAFT_610862 [Kockovaella imperatae]
MPRRYLLPTEDPPKLYLSLVSDQDRGRIGIRPRIDEASLDMWDPKLQEKIFGARFDVELELDLGGANETAADSDTLLPTPGVWDEVSQVIERAMATAREVKTAGDVSIAAGKGGKATPTELLTARRQALQMCSILEQLDVLTMKIQDHAEGGYEGLHNQSSNQEDLASSQDLMPDINREAAIVESRLRYVLCRGSIKMAQGKDPDSVISEAWSDAWKFVGHKMAVDRCSAYYTRRAAGETFSEEKDPGDPEAEWVISIETGKDGRQRPVADLVYPSESLSEPYTMRVGASNVRRGSSSETPAEWAGKHSHDFSSIGDTARKLNEFQGLLNGAVDGRARLSREDGREIVKRIIDTPTEATALTIRLANSHRNADDLCSFPQYGSKAFAEADQRLQSDYTDTLAQLEDQVKTIQSDQGDAGDVLNDLIKQCVTTWTLINDPSHANSCMTARARLLELKMMKRELAEEEESDDEDSLARKQEAIDGQRSQHMKELEEALDTSKKSWKAYTGQSARSRAALRKNLLSQGFTDDDFELSPSELISRIAADRLSRKQKALMRPVDDIPSGLGLIGCDLTQEEKECLAAEVASILQPNAKTNTWNSLSSRARGVATSYLRSLDDRSAVDINSRGHEDLQSDIVRALSNYTPEQQQTALQLIHSKTYDSEENESADYS